MFSSQTANLVVLLSLTATFGCSSSFTPPISAQQTTPTPTPIPTVALNAISPLAFGAKFDGITDDGPAINSAIAAQAAKGGGTVELPPGSTRWSTPVLMQTAVHLIGASGLGTKVLCDTGTNPCLTHNIANQLAGLVVSDFAMYPFSSASSGTKAIYFANLQHSEIARLRIENFYNLSANSGTAIWLGGVVPSNMIDTNISNSVAFDNIHDNTLVGCYDCMVNSAYIPPGFPTLNPTGIQGITQNIFSNNNMWYVFHKGLVFRNSANANVVVGGVVELNANNAQAYVQSDDPAYSQQIVVTSGGSGYTASAAGTATYTGAGCTVNPVLSIETNSSGVVYLPLTVVTPGVCSSFPTASASWTVNGLGAGTGVALTLIDSPVNAYSGINTYVGVTETATAGISGQCAFGGGWAFGTNASGFITDQSFANGNAEGNVLDCMTGDQSSQIIGNHPDGSVGAGTMISQRNNNVAYNGVTGVYNLTSGGTFTPTPGQDNIVITNGSNIIGQTINLPCNPNDGTDITFSATASIVTSVSWTTTAGCTNPANQAITTHDYGLPTAFGLNYPITLHYISGSNSWTTKAGTDPSNANLQGGSFNNANIKVLQYTVSTLPACTAGQQAFATNGRNNGEGSGAGTGVLIYCNSAGQWLAPWSGVAITQ